MSVAVRVIPCLDVDAGRVVKGVNFKDLRDAGDPVELAARYGAEGADELTFLDVTASSGGRETMIEVVRRTADILDVDVADDAAVEIASRSRGTPRIANRLLRRVRDYADVRAGGAIDLDAARGALAIFDVDELGLDALDRSVLHALVVGHGGGPVGLNTLAIAVGEEPSTVEDVCEPYLVRAGLVSRTSRGRVATALAWRHLGLEPPEGLVEVRDPAEE